MRRCKYFLVLVVLIAAALPAPANGIFGKRPAPANPMERAQKLVAAVQTSPDDNERLQAVQGLREFDAVAYPNVVSALVSALKSDKSVSVRIEAARSLGRIRPLTSMAGEALLEASL